LYLTKKHLSAVAIHAEINSVLEEGMIGYSTVTHYLRKQSFANASHLAPEEPDFGAADTIDNATLQALDEQPFASLRQIAKRTLISMSTVRSRLVNKMTYKLKYCKWIPHRLSEAQKRTRVAPSKRFLDQLGSVQHQGWKYLVTLDEASFYFSNQHEQIWLPDQEYLPTIQRQTISSRKTMLTVVWNPHGFHLASLLPKGEKRTSQYYIDHILPEICALRDARDRRKLVAHASNARPHVAERVTQYLEDNNLKSASHPPYSPRLSTERLFSLRPRGKTATRDRIPDCKRASRWGGSNSG
jgi:hypothetical protein